MNGNMNAVVKTDVLGSQKVYTSRSINKLMKRDVVVFVSFPTSKSNFNATIYPTFILVKVSSRSHWSTRVAKKIYGLKAHKVFKYIISYPVDMIKSTNACCTLGKFDKIFIIGLSLL